MWKPNLGKISTLCVSFCCRLTILSLLCIVGSEEAEAEATPELTMVNAFESFYRLLYIDVR
jgi:hypothetical protein